MSVQVTVAAGIESVRQVAAVVATHKHCYPLQGCLESLRSSLPHPSDLIFVDNGSSEVLSSWATDKFPDISILQLKENRFFCGGYNAGIRLALERGYNFVLIVNADTQVRNEGFIPALIDAARRWPRAAFIGPLVYYRAAGVYQKTCLNFPSVLRSLLIWLPWRLGKDRFMTQTNREQEVEFLNGVCVLCRASALRDIGLMDETFGGYVEDADWSLRARNKGWISVFTPVPSVTHYEDEVGYEAYSLKTFMLKRNTVLWFLKAGRRRSARFYAFASILLAKVRGMAAGSEIDRKNHRQFCVLLERAYHGLLRGDAPGEWYGPPLAPWNGARNA
jgi:GT2 family glycosyltransferase